MPPRHEEGAPLGVLPRDNEEVPAHYRVYPGIVRRNRAVISRPGIRLPAFSSRPSIAIRQVLKGYAKAVDRAPEGSENTRR
jgi:hypothetical protein